MSEEILFADGPMAGKSLSYWKGADVLAGPWPGYYHLAHVLDPETMGLRFEYRYHAGLSEQP